MQAKKAFTLIEVLIVMFIALIAFTSFYAVSTVGTKYIIESKNRLAAVSVVNGKMEIVRNLSYEKIGTLGSIDIPGKLIQNDNETINGRTYNVTTSVRYFDDPMDGTISSSPADPIPNDYKIVRIVVSWKDSNGQDQSVSSSSRFVPPGLETSEGGSPLSINVVDGETLLPIAQASVHISNNAVVPTINDTIQTDNNGHIILPAAKISSDNKLTITKSGYETVDTMDFSPTFIPIYGHVSVVNGFLNTYNYFLNRLSDLTVKTIDYQNNPVGNISFSITGGKIIGNTNLGVAVYSMSATNGTTDAVSGEKKYSSISPGNYDIKMSANAQFQFIDYEPSASPALLPAGTDMTYVLHVADKDVNALFVEVKDIDVPNDPIGGAKVTLSDGATDIFTDKLSSLRGVIFYPDGALTLDNKEYTLKITADGYADHSEPVTIDKFTHVEVKLTRN